MRHTLYDDSGLMAIIDPDAYESFVDEDWDFDLLMKHFVKQMELRHMLIWETGLGNIWDVQSETTFQSVKGFREITGGIQSTAGRLLMTSYEDLTMAASRQKIQMPEKRNEVNLIPVSPGSYSCRVMQLGDPESDAPFEPGPHFVCELTQSDELPAAWAEHAWRQWC